MGIFLVPEEEIYLGNRKDLILVGVFRKVEHLFLEWLETLD